jgi:hypothetical protein
MVLLLILLHFQQKLILPILRYYFQIIIQILVSVITGELDTTIVVVALLTTSIGIIEIVPPTGASSAGNSASGFLLDQRASSTFR